MIILDTNVVSALMRPDRNPSVVTWLDSQNSDKVWTTVITIYELRFGIETLLEPVHKRRVALNFDDILLNIFRSRIFTFDLDAAHETAKLTAKRKLEGRSIDVRDTQIAGIALSRQAAVATRNIKHFADAGIALIDPWNAP